MNTRLTALLAIERPVLLAPMDLVAGARLTAAVSAAGGFGILGGGYGDDAWLAHEIALLRELGFGPGSAFGIGFITWSLAERPHLLDVALAAGPRAIMLSFGDLRPFVPKIRAAGALLIAQVQTEAMADDALAAGADVLVAQGAEAGGHGVSRGTFGLVPAIVDRARGRCPVVAAGGVADGRGLAASLMLGASGVLIGTRFYASDEADGTNEAKRRICVATGDDTTRGIVFDISKQHVWPAPFTARCLTNDHARRWTGRELELVQRAGALADDYAAARAARNYDVAAVSSGEAAGLIHAVEPAGAVVVRIVDEAARLLRDAGASPVAP